MAEEVKNPPVEAPAQQQPAARPCPQDCRLCSTPQQVYCCTRMMFDSSKMLQECRQLSIQSMAAMAELKELIAKKNNPEELSIPFAE